jgi:peptidoglycan/LPS O-acetylase OafA/YrhL
VTATIVPERGFRPEIQALRAVAVALVLFFHLFPERLPGGFVGVDVFFVISGYLITAHLAHEAVATGTIGLKRFWGRRIRRLLPAATVVLLASLLAMLAFMPRSLWQQTALEVGASALYVQNWFLGATAVDYLGAANVPTLAQHYWSLSVEEQFYLVWPVLIVLALLVARRLPRRRTLILLLSAIAVASFVYSVLETIRSQPFAYFNTGTRVWEFAVGGLLALGLTERVDAAPERVRAAVGIAGGWIGLVLIAFSALQFNGETPFPGPWAALPVLGTALVIVGGTAAGSSWAPAFVARFGPLRLLGDLSYSIYLWHWPLIVVAPFVAGHSIGWKWKLAIVVASVTLAWATKRFVEDPVRTGRYWRAPSRRSFTLAAASIAVVVAASSVTWIAVERGVEASAKEAAAAVGEPCFGAPAMLEAAACDDPFAVPEGLDTAFAQRDGFFVPGTCTFPRPEVMLQVCEYGQLEDPDTTVLFVGNSHATHLIPGALQYAEEHNWRIMLMTRRNCLGVTTRSVGAAPDQACLDWSAAVLENIRSRNDIDLVVFPSYRSVEAYIAPPDATNAQLDQLREQIADTFRDLVERGQKVAVIDDSPAAPFDVPECVDLHRADYDPCSFPGDESPENLVTEAADRVPDVQRIDPRPWTCDDSACHSVVGGVVVFFDDNHFTGTYARTLAPYLGADLERVLRTTP